MTSIKPSKTTLEGFFRYNYLNTNYFDIIDNAPSTTVFFKTKKENTYQLPFVKWLNL